MAHGVDNCRRVFAHLVIKSRVGKLKIFFGASRRIFSKNVCPPWPETVPAPLTEVCRVFFIVCLLH